MSSTLTNLLKEKAPKEQAEGMMVESEPQSDQNKEDARNREQAKDMEVQQEHSRKPSIESASQVYTLGELDLPKPEQLAIALFPCCAITESQVEECKTTVRLKALAKKAVETFEAYNLKTSWQESRVWKPTSGGCLSHQSFEKGCTIYFLCEKC
jgi:hypothetical protein